MGKRLPKEVTKFLLENPKELENIQKHIKAIEEDKKWRSEIASRRAIAPMVPCGMYGCTTLRNAMDFMCSSCQYEQSQDPDAFK